MEAITDLFKILSDETRLRILHLLTHEDLCVCEMVEVLELSQPKISKHIAKIKNGHLIKANRNEQYIYYSLNKNYDYYALLKESIRNTAYEAIYKKDLEKLQSIDEFVKDRY